MRPLIFIPMRFMLSLAIALMSFCVQAQIYVWEGDGVAAGMPVMNIVNGTLYPELSFMNQDALLTATNDKIYQGRSTSVFDEVYWIQDNKLFSDQGHFSGDCLLTYHNGKIYRGDSRMFMDQLFSFKNGQLFEGNQTTRLDILYSFEGDVSVAELFAVMLVLELI